MNREHIDQFVNQVLIEANLDDIPDDFKKDYITQLGYELQRRLGILAVNSLDQKSYIDFSAFIKENPDQDFLSAAIFFKKRIPHFHELVAKGMLDFKFEIFERAHRLQAVKQEYVLAESAVL